MWLPQWITFKQEAYADIEHLVQLHSHPLSAVEWFNHLRLGGIAQSENAAIVRAIVAMARTFGPNGRLKRKRTEKIIDIIIRRPLL